MFSVTNLSVQYTGEDIFQNISFLVNANDKIGLVGKNGVGKSTLMKIMAGQQEATGGSVVIPAGKTVGYLSQEFRAAGSRSILEETLTIFEEAGRLAAETEAIGRELETRTDYESDDYMNLIATLAEKGERLRLLDTGKMEGGAEKVLTGLGFLPSDLQRPLSEFSGGWQMRVELAKLLLSMPDLLLLDEPTNHLDIESIIWLENFLTSYQGAVMMVSHDRMFLDNITQRTIEIVNGRLYDYRAPYSRFLELRQERIRQQEAAWNNQQRFIAQQERFIERFRAKNTKAKQVQSKIRKLDKLDRVEFDETDRRTIRFRFPPVPRSGDIVLEAGGLSKSYGSRVILHNLGFTVHRGERIAFVGRNGEGKTTLVRMIMNETGYEGRLRTGHNVETGYYAQAQENTLDDGATVYETVDNLATDEWRNISRLRGLLGSFLFREDDMDKKVKVLSGGEKSRLALARLLLRPVNLLLLDEPTNHLDMSAKNVLKEALMKYDGTLLVVSHDRDFLDGLTNRTFEFINGGIRDRLGDIREFLAAHEADSFRTFETGGGSVSKAVPQAREANDRRRHHKDQRQQRRTETAIRKAEERITRLEKEAATVEAQLADPSFYADPKAPAQAIARHEMLKRDLAAAMTEWEKLHGDA